MQFGLLGRKLGHSFSPQIHVKLAGYPYRLYECEPDHLKQFIQEAAYSGLNVTMPYKRDVIPYLTELTPIAIQIGAVNTILKRPDGTTIGHNTDYSGFLYMLNHSGLSVTGKKILVLGSGGASATVTTVLSEMGADPVVISRTGKNNYQNLDLHCDCAIIVNTTPVGMYPNTGVSPINLNHFQNLEGVLDLVYNPLRTQLLIEAEKRHLIALNGLWMLIAQARESAEWFTGKSISDDRIEEIHAELTSCIENIVLIGMPGCGKSTVASCLGSSVGRQVVDIDEKIIDTIGCSISDFFHQHGEEAFRRLETEVIARYGKESGLIIATGGGCITRPKNYDLLHQNGKLIWLRRDTSLLATDGRPVSQNSSLEALYAARKPLYKEFRDLQVENGESIQDTVEAIRRLL